MGEGRVGLKLHNGDTILRISLPLGYYLNHLYIGIYLKKLIVYWSFIVLGNKK